jgi:hypothetical protein
VSTEKAEGAVYGIIKRMRSGSGFLGVGKIKNPENALLITNRRIIFFLVPMAGAGKFVDEVDFTQIQNLFAKKKIKERGQKMVSSKNPAQILSANKSNFALSFSDIKKIKIKSFFGRGLTIEMNDGKKWAYTLYNKEDIKTLKKKLSKYVPGSVK